jgi:hypothetical protein
MKTLCTIHCLEPIKIDNFVLNLWLKFRPFNNVVPHQLENLDLFQQGHHEANLDGGSGFNTKMITWLEYSHSDFGKIASL